MEGFSLITLDGSLLGSTLGSSDGIGEGLYDGFSDGSKACDWTNSKTLPNLVDDPFSLFPFSFLFALSFDFSCALISSFTRRSMSFCDVNVLCSVGP